MNPADLPPVAKAWVRQILSDEVLEILRSHPKSQLDLRLSAAGGKVRARPVVVLNGGVPTMIDPDEITGETVAPAGIAAGIHV